MTICFFSAQYLPTVGGVERYTYNLAKRVVAAGHRAIVVTSALPGLPSQETDDCGIEIFRFPVWPFMNGRFPVLKPGTEFSELAKILWSMPIDFCLINTRFYVSSLYAARMCKKKKIPAIVVDHSTGHLPMGNPVLNFAGACYEHMAAAFIKHYTPRFYGVSRAVCRWLEHFHIHAEGQLYNAVEPAEVRSLTHAPDAVNWRSKLGLNETERIVAFVGRIIPEKGVFELIQAFSSAVPEHCSLLIAGDGPLLASLRESCPEHVYLLGSTAYPQAMQLLAQADLYCLPTYYAEGFPTTFLEAAACGCPILTTRTGGSDELLPDESYGIQLDSVQIKPLADALTRCLSDDAWRTAAAEKTSRRLDELFTWDAVTVHLLELAAQSKQ